MYVAAGCSGRAVHQPTLPLSALASSLKPGAGRDGTKLVVEPRDGVKPVVRAIDSSRFSVFFEAYILTQHGIVRALQRAAAQGVAVYVLLDPHPFGMGNQPSEMASSLRAAGVSVRWTSSHFYYTHAKFFVVDDRLAVVSTANFSQAAFTQNRELLVFDRQRSDVHDISNVFRSDWDHIPFEHHDSDLILSPGSRGALAQVLRRARRSIEVYAEEVADPELDRLLIELDSRVRVKVILASSYRSPGLTQLTKGGVAVRGLRYPYVHAKMFLVDGRIAFVGSENMSATSLDSNRELGILLRGRTVAQANAIFNRDWSKAAAKLAITDH
jgi:phosphatidylserine/phosphatidylglycerophosphate/cardiolipin synthase-like enzyme